MKCPSCDSDNVIKNGSIHNGPKCQCNDCGRQFVINPQPNQVPQWKKNLIDKMLLERISLAGIARVVDVSESWLHLYVNKKYDAVPRTIQISEISEDSKLIIQCDEVWSFINNKSNKYWIWLAIDINTKNIVGLYIGSRDKNGAKGLWDSLPLPYRKFAICYTDFWEAYQAIFPSDRHHAVGKESGLTNIIERFNGTLRQRISRLVRKTLSFSKNISNHIGAIWLFIHHYNRKIAENF